MNASDTLVLLAAGAVSRDYHWQRCSYLHWAAARAS